MLNMMTDILVKLSIAILTQQDSAVGRATGYGLDGPEVGVRDPVRVRFFSTPRRPDRFWAPPNLLSKGF
jgi:hypothetical protein